MSSETQVVLEVDAAQVVLSREKASSAWSGRWKMCMALLAVAVCVAAAVFFTFNKAHNKPDETDDIRHTLRQVSTSAKAAIHLTGHLNDQISDSVEWREDMGQAFSHGGLKLKDNEIHIPRNGLYFVYSQASYSVSCTSDEEQHLSHALWRYSASYGGDKPLLSAMRTACGKPALDNEYQWYSAIYVGAVFNLRAGDKLRTEMVKDMLEYVETNDGKTFFGVFAL